MHLNKITNIYELINVTPNVKYRIFTTYKM